MSADYDGGPAFPVATEGDEESGRGHSNKDGTWQHAGLSMRDYFAAKAMQGLIVGSMGQGANLDAQAAVAIAEGSYFMADAMLKEQAK